MQFFSGLFEFIEGFGRVQVQGFRPGRLVGRSHGLLVVVLIVIVVKEVVIHAVAHVEHAANACDEGDDDADADQDGRHGALSVVGDIVGAAVIDRHLAKRPGDFTLSGCHRFCHGITSVVANIKAGDGDDVAFTLQAREHALCWAVSNQRKRKVNRTVGLCSERWRVAICFVVHQFNGGRRARDDRPCKPDHHVEGIRVGDRTGDENIRRIAIPLKRGRPAIYGCGERDVGEGWTRGLVGFVGFVGLVSTRVGCRLECEGCGETWHVVHRWVVAQSHVKTPVVRPLTADDNFVAPCLCRTVAGFRTGGIRSGPIHVEVGQVY